MSVSSMTCSAAESSLGSSTSGGMRLRLLLREEWAAFCFGKTKRSLPRLVVHQQQEVDFVKGAGRLPFVFRAPALHAPHERPAPSIRRRIPDGPKHRRVGVGVKWPGAELERRLEGEAAGMPEPGRVVFERGALLVFASRRP